MKIIYTYSRFMDFLRIPKKDSSESTFLTFEEDAIEKYIIPVLGAELTQALSNYAADKDYPFAWEGVDASDIKTAMAKLLPYVESAVARFTMLVASPSFDINTMDGGFVVNGGNNFAPASTDRVNRLNASMERLGNDALDSALAFLEENYTLFPVWVNSTAYTMEQSNLINSASLFHSFVNIDRSRLKFSALRQIMSNVEALKIIPAISQDYFDELLEQIRSNDITSDNEKVLNLLRKALANYTYADDGNGDQFNRLGDAYLGMARKILDANPDVYETYAESQVYQAENAVYNTRYENNEDSKIFVIN